MNGIYEELENIDHSKVDLDAIDDMVSLGSVLMACNYPKEAVAILKAEILNKNRYSHVTRIYGRYRTLIPNRDLDLIFLWASKRGKS